MKRHLNPKSKLILSVLSDGKYHSGNELGNTLQVSRTSIAKYIHKLQSLGLDIFTVRGRGYALPYNIELLNEEFISKECSETSIQIFDMIDSTNRYMMTYINKFNQGSCILAETQTTGVGRSNSSWISPFGAQLILSMFWTYKNISISGLSIAIGLATVKTLEKFGIKNIGLKWPNDIYANQKKLAGILIETRASVKEGFQIVIGIGINLINTKIMTDNHIDSISIADISDNYISKNKLAVELIKEYKNTLINFEKNRSSTFCVEWNKRDIFKDCKVKLIDKYTNTTIIEGIERGINDTGSILIENPQGIIESFHIGDISLRK